MGLDLGLDLAWDATTAKHHESGLVLPVDGIMAGDKKTLELHQRLVHLATLRSEALDQLSELDGLKVALTERKVVEQSRLIAALDSRLAAAHASVEPHRVAVHDRIKALEREAALLSSILQGTAPLPQPQWAASTQRYKQLQQQQLCCQKQLRAAGLSSSLADPLQGAEAPAVQAVEQQLHQERAARLLAEEQQRNMEQELVSLRLLAEQLAVRLRLPGQQLATLQRQQQLLPRHAGQSCCSADALLLQPQQPAGRSPEGCHPAGPGFLATAQELRQRLQQLHDVAAATSCGSEATAGEAAHARPWQPEQQDRQPGGATQAGSSDLFPADGPDAASADRAAAAQQHLRSAVLGGVGSRHDACCNSAKDGMQPICSSSSSWGVADVPRQSDEARAHEGRLRQAYQQQLRQVQARYQQELRRGARQHQQALQAQAQAHTEALTHLTQQHSEACTRLAAAAAVEADLRQQLARLQQQHQQLQRQLSKVEMDSAASAAAAAALAQVQHEQQLLQAKQEQDNALRDVRQQLQQLRQCMREQVAAVPTAGAVAALVQEAAAAQLQSQEQHHQAALREREEQHASLLQELVLLKQLQEEPSNASASSEGLDSAAAAAQGVLAGLDAEQQLQLPADRRQHVGSPNRLAAARQAAASRVDQQQQQQQGSPMSALIEAVLGPGSRAAAQQAAHLQHQQQQQQHPWQQLEQQCDEAAVELDQMLGLQQQQPQPGAAAFKDVSAVQLPHQRQQRQPDSCSQAQVSAPADIVQQCQEVLQCLSPVQSCSSTVSSRAASPPGQGRKSAQGLHRHEVSSRRQAGTVRSGRQQQQDRPGEACLRCGSDAASSPARCCFHPGLIAVPGPLLYSPEFMRQATCRPDQPGCYVRREHSFAPALNAARVAAASTAKRAGSPSPSRATRMAAVQVVSDRAGPRPRSMLPQPRR